MVSGMGGVTCHNCGQHNTGDGQFCVRCGDRLPDAGATPPPTDTEVGWEPPAEWTPDPQWESAGAGGAQAWNEQSRTWGPGGAYTPPPSTSPSSGYPHQGG